MVDPKFRNSEYAFLFLDPKTAAKFEKNNFYFIDTKRQVKFQSWKFVQEILSLDKSDHTSSN